MSKIEWTNRTWNPVVGCSKVSAGCKNCYAIRMAWRLQHIHHSSEKYAGTVEKSAGGQLNWTGKVNLSEKDLLKPLTWKKPAMIFVNSESDLFHDSVPFEFIDKVFAVMALCQQHTFQVLTKRPQRMVEYFKRNYAARIMTELDIISKENKQLFEACSKTAFNIAITPAPEFHNIWLGVSVENQQAANERVPLLLSVRAAVRFLSCEPLLGPIDLTLITQTVSPGYFGDCLQPYHLPNCDKETFYPKINWVIAGGESGNDARAMHPCWVRLLRDQCNKAGTPFFFKQWGEYYTKSILMGTGEPMFRMFDSMQHWINKAQTWVRAGRCISIDGRECHIGKDFQECAYPVVIMDKVGKKKSGRLLDGREWNEFPQKDKLPVVDDDPDLYVGGFD
jgi:protein gp37